MMFAGGLGLCETMHVKLIVDPVSMNISGMPIIVVTGSMNGCAVEKVRERMKAIIFDDEKFSH